MPLKKTTKNKQNTDTSFLNLNSKESSMDIYNVKNRQYTAVLQIGSRGEDIEVLLDTGSSILWVADPAIADQSTNTFHCTRSKTCQPFLDDRYPITYAVGAISGYRAIDQVQIGGLTVPNFSMILADMIKDMPARSFDGILGLSLGRYHHQFPTTLELLKESGQISTGTFSMYLGDYEHAEGDSTGEIIFGGYDPEYAAGDFQFVKVHNKFSTSHWSADMKTLSYGENTGLSAKIDYPTVFDSGTSLLVLPASFIESVMAKGYDKGVSFRYDRDSELYICDCSARKRLEDLVFTFDGVTLSVSPSSYVLSNYGRCYLGLQPMKGMAGFDNPMILGDVLLKHYYVLYNADDGTVGFAPAVSKIYIPKHLIFVIVLTIAVIAGACIYVRTRKGTKTNPFGGLKSKGVVIGSNYGTELSSQQQRYYNPYRSQDDAVDNESQNREAPGYPLPVVESIEGNKVDLMNK